MSKLSLMWRKLPDAVWDTVLKPAVVLLGSSVKRRPFQAKSDYSSQDNTFGGGFKLGKADAPNQCT